MLKIESKTIGGHEYKVRQLVATKGRLVLLTLARIIGPAAALAAGAKETGKEEAFAKVIEALLANLTPEDFTSLCNTFAESTDVVISDEKGRREPKLSNVFDLHFAGNYQEMIDWLVFCVEVNFASFFDGLKAKSGGTSGPAA
jgi:hypothetical protein